MSGSENKPRVVEKVPIRVGIDDEEQVFVNVGDIVASFTPEGAIELGRRLIHMGEHARDWKDHRDFEKPDVEGGPKSKPPFTPSVIEREQLRRTK